MPKEKIKTASTSESTKTYAGSRYEFLSDNINFRYRCANNSPKVGHALIKKNSDGRAISAQQFTPPENTSAGTPTIRPMLNIAQVNMYGKNVYTANSPRGGEYKAKRLLALSTDSNDDDLEIALFSPRAPSEFWGTGKDSTPYFKSGLDKSTKESLEKKIQTSQYKTKPNKTTTVIADDIIKREGVKYRNPDQNTVMKHSALNEVENFVKRYKNEIHPDILARLQKQIDAPFDAKDPKARTAKPFDKYHRPEWLHAGGYSLTPMAEDPQIATNLGSARRCDNTDMMILERVARDMAVNDPAVSVEILPTFFMLLDSDIIKSIEFDVAFKRLAREITLKQNIDPLSKYPLLPKPTDAAQAAIIVHSLLYRLPLANEQHVNSVAARTNKKRKFDSNDTTSVKMR